MPPATCSVEDMDACSSMEGVARRVGALRGGERGPKALS